MVLSQVKVLRFFSADKVIQSPIMNRMGAQVARTVLARTVYNLRAPRVDPSVSQYVTALQTEGSVTIPNFLSPEAFDTVVQKTHQIMEREKAHSKDIHHGPNTVHVISERDAHFAKDLPEFYGDPRLSAIFNAVERKP